MIVTAPGSGFDEVSGTGSAVWRSLEGSPTVAEVIELLAQEYRGPRTHIARDVEELLRVLVDRGWVEEIE